jgi:hypothetical protein
LHYWRIVALVGTIIFSLSGVAPMVSYGLLNPTISLSLFNLYSAVGQGWNIFDSAPLDTATIGILLTMIIYPIALILGLVSLIKRKIAILAGTLGLVCWTGTLAYLAQFDFLSYTGLGVYIGIAGAVIMAIAYFLKPSSTAPQIAPLPATSPPPPSLQ